MTIRSLLVFCSAFSFAGCVSMQGETLTGADGDESCLSARLIRGGAATFHSDFDEWIRLKSGKIEFGYSGSDDPRMELSHVAHARNGNRCEYARLDGGGRPGRYFLEEKNGVIIFGRIDDNNSFMPIRFHVGGK